MSINYSNIVDNLVEGAGYIPSVNFDLRPANYDINLLVIHSASLPKGEYDNNELETLFKGNVHKDFLMKHNMHDNYKVSPHIYINRQGGVVQFVSFDKRAWHAGVSIFDGKNNCNDFSIGIELQGTDDSYFTEDQYGALINVTQLIMRCYPNIKKNRIVGHSDIAPDRKSDPGKFFDWDLYLAKL